MRTRILLAWMLLSGHDGSGLTSIIYREMKIKCPSIYLSHHRGVLYGIETLDWADPF